MGRSHRQPLRLGRSQAAGAGSIHGSPTTCATSTSTAKGNQDRSLSTSAVFLESRIAIVKEAIPADDTWFGFTATGGLSPTPFTLTDPASDSRTLDSIYDYTTYTFTEDAAPNWDLTFNDTGL